MNNIMNTKEAKSKLKFYLIFTLVFWVALPLLGFIVFQLIDIPDSPALETGVSGLFGVIGLLWLIETFRSFKAIYILLKSTKIVIPVLIFIGLLAVVIFSVNLNSNKIYIVGEDVFEEDYWFVFDESGKAVKASNADINSLGAYWSQRWYSFENGKVITDGIINNQYGLVAKIKDTFIDGVSNSYYDEESDFEYEGEYYEENWEDYIGNLSRSTTLGPNGLEDGLDTRYNPDGSISSQSFWTNNGNCLKWEKSYFSNGQVWIERFDLECDGIIKSFRYDSDGNLVKRSTQPGEQY